MWHNKLLLDLTNQIIDFLSFFKRYHFHTKKGSGIRREKRQTLFKQLRYAGLNVLFKHEVGNRDEWLSETLLIRRDSSCAAAIFSWSPAVHDTNVYAEK